MRKQHDSIESIAVRRAKVADADKVRYRVYKTPTEFIAVIAESALMAVKVSGVKTPHKIVRDIPTAGIAIEAQKMAAIDASAEKVAMASAQQNAIKKQLFTEVKPLDALAKQGDFKPITLGDLQKAGMNRARILSPEMLSEIIEQHSKVGATPVPEAEKIDPVAIETAAVLETVVAPVSVAPASVAPAAPVVPAEPELSQEEKVMNLANEILPSAKDLPPPEPLNLSSDEVDKLLNE